MIAQLRAPHEDHQDYDMPGVGKPTDQVIRISRDDLVALTIHNKNRDFVNQEVHRGNLDLTDLASVVVWLARHGNPLLRMRLARQLDWFEGLAPEERQIVEDIAARQLNRQARRRLAIGRRKSEAKSRKRR